MSKKQAETESSVYTTQTLTYLPSKYAGSDLEAFWLWPAMAIPASVQPESGRIVYAGSDFPHPMQFHFFKEGPDHIVQN